MIDWTKHTLKFRYLVLERLQGDCEYYLGQGRKNNTGLLNNNATEQIQMMIDIWNTLSTDEQPDWLTWGQIEKYANDMGVKI